ncbi:MAG: MerR family transcriptional regulator [Alphaproteobacteria bacterium]|nr:MerR family transcriptional regulator [Alphaproteobacteria bacterium]
MTEKAKDAFKTISEVSALLDVPPHVLRFWETKFSTLRPLKRSGGRRYYRPDDVAMLQRIRALLYDDGFTIKGAQKHLRSKGAGDEGGVPIGGAVQAASPAARPLAEAGSILTEVRSRLAALRTRILSV